MWNYNHSPELKHHGILGMKWGVRRYQNKDGTLTTAGKRRKNYRPQGIRSAMAKRANRKVDKSFEKWKINDELKKKAINAGKESTLKKIAYEKDKTNRELKKSYKNSNKEYKQALKKNTTYRKGSVKQEVGKDRSRKYLSEAKKIEKQLLKRPNDKTLMKQHSDMLNKYGVERAKARRAQEVASNRSRKIASLKRTKTLALKGAMAGGIVAGGTIIINKYLEKTGRQSLKTDTVKKAAAAGKNIFKYAKYFYG